MKRLYHLNDDTASLLVNISWNASQACASNGQIKCIFSYWKLHFSTNQFISI